MTINNCVYNPVITTILSFLLIIFTIINLKKLIFKSKLVIPAFFLVLTGGISNLLQRLTLGCVKDHYSFFSLFYFNLADIAVSLGVALLVLVVIKFKEEKNI